MVDDNIVNYSGNRPFQEVLEARLSRRSVIAGGLSGATLAFLGGGAFGSSESVSAASGPGGIVNFTSIPKDSGPMPTIAPEYEYAPLAPWREKLDGSGTSFDLDGFTAEQQEQSMGIGHDGMWYLGDNNRGFLCINHEFGRTSHAVGKPFPESLEDVRLSQAGHGVTVVRVARKRDEWVVRPNSRNRRITPNTPATFSGPAVGSPLLEPGEGHEFAGTLNNCSSGYTPWGTYLTCEENFNGYFGTSDESWEPNPMQARYGLNSSGFGYGWHVFDPRFDLANEDYPNEENSFGWVVEIDPLDGSSKPVKRTALGRFKHEGAAVTVGEGGRVVVYMGDDQRFDYIYKFVSSGSWQAMRASGISPLDEGTLYVARFDDGGTGEWLELSTDNPALAGWSIDEILINARGAADVVGATPMDRPEWTTVGTNRQVFCTLTNNSQRVTPNVTSPNAPNFDGYIIRWVDSGRFVGTTFEWDLYAISTDVSDADGQMYGSPDGLWADGHGRIFVQTDGAQPDGANDQMLVGVQNAPVFSRMFTGVPSCEVTGIATTPDQRTMFVNLQHPGNGDPSLTNWPEEFTGAGGPVPRDSTVVIRRKDKGFIGQ